MAPRRTTPVRRTKFTVEVLEDRCTPATFGNPWPDGMHLTLSFAPEGTDISGEGSSLSRVLGSLGDITARTAILRAFQAWAVHANINIGIVADSGAQFGAGGAIQNDPRFGDIRIGARSLGSEVLAITAPPNVLSTFSGNVVLNTDQEFVTGKSTSGYDLFTAFLQEAGHAFGIAGSADVKSVMHEYFRGVRTGLSSADIESIKSLYGARRVDKWEGVAGNNTLATATSIKDPIEADLTSTADVDIYKFTNPLISTGTTVRLQARGLSLAMAKVDVLDGSGNVIASKSAGDIFDNDVTLTLSNLRGGARYYVRVSSAAGDEFGIGSYKLSVRSNSSLSSLSESADNVVQLIDGELGVNDTLQAATKLVASAMPVDAGDDYMHRSSLSAANDVDYYRITSPQAAAGTTLNLMGLVWAVDGTALDPRIAVFDSAGKLVNAQILTNDDGSFVIQIENVQSKTDYFVRVSSDSQRIGDYGLALNFQSAKQPATLQSSGSLSSGQTSVSAILSVVQSGQFHFALSGGTAANTSLMMTIRDSGGQLVFQLTTPSGDTRSGDVILRAGSYTVTVSAISSNGQPISAINYFLAAFLTSDPVGARKASTDSSPQGGSSGSSGSGGGDGTSPTWTASDGSEGSYWY